jgi:hypothetical protein
MALTTAWLTGLVGAALIAALNLRAPLALSDEVFLRQFAYRETTGTPTRGLRVVMNPDRLRRDLCATDWRYRLIPPGIFNQKRVLSGGWSPRTYTNALNGPIPFEVVFDNAAPWRPQASMQLPAAEFNRVLSQRMGDRLSSREDYVFGHYDLMQDPEFDALTISSETVPSAVPIQRRQLHVSATGSLRVRVEDGPLAIQSTANVKELAGTIDIDVLRDEAGLGFRHRVTIKVLRLSMDNVPPWLERVIAERLRDSMERSLNRKKKRERVSKRRYPTWIPLDIALTIRLSPDA